MSKKIALIYEIILVCLALISVIFMWSNNGAAWYIDKIIWLLFAIDVTVRIIISKNRWHYIRTNPFDIIAALPLDSIFQTARIVRLFRVLRLFTIGKKHLKPIQGIMQTNGLSKVLTISVIMFIISTILVTHFEPSIDTFENGLWWSIVTATTVGYGDISPQTGIGRIIAVLLMLIGIGIIGMLTGSITTYFVRGKNYQNPTVEFIKSELDRYEELSKSERRRLELLIKDLNDSVEKNK